MKPRKRARTFAQGLVYDGQQRLHFHRREPRNSAMRNTEATRTAKISICVEGRKGIARIRRERISASTASSYRPTAERYLLPRFGARSHTFTAPAVMSESRHGLREHPPRDRELRGPLRRGREESPFRKALIAKKVNKPTNELSEVECAAFLGAFNDRQAFVAHLPREGSVPLSIPRCTGEPPELRERVVLEHRRSLDRPRTSAWSASTRAVGLFHPHGNEETASKTELPARQVEK